MAAQDTPVPIGAVRRVYKSIRSFFQTDITEISQDKLQNQIESELNKTNKKLQKATEPKQLSKLKKRRTQLKRLQSLQESRFTELKQKSKEEFDVVQKSPTGKKYRRSYRGWTDGEEDIIREAKEQGMSASDAVSYYNERVPEARTRSEDSVKTKYYRVDT